MYRIYLTLVLSCTLTLSIAQTPRPSEVRAQRMNEENAESALKKEMFDAEIFGTEDSAFNINEVPEKWSKESAVILAQKEIILLDRKSSTYFKEEQLVRKKIKLLDKAAVETYSEFYFNSPASLVEGTNVGIQIIKPDGKKNNVDISSAVSVEKDVRIPSLYRSSYNLSYDYKKLAIPNLEPGDIIDYYVKSKKDNYTYSKMHIFPDVLLTLHNTYPTVYQKQSFSFDKGFYINMISANGAPELQDISLAESKFKSFELVDRMREKLKDERWTYEYRSTPTIKFQIYFVENKALDDYLFLGEPGEVKKNVSQEEVLEKISLRFSKMYVYEPKAYAAFIKTNYKSVTDPIEQLKLAYYQYRHQTLDENSNSLHFAKVMAGFCDLKKIKYKVYAGIPRSIAPLKELVLPGELYFMIKIEGDKPFILMEPGRHTNFGDLHSGVEDIDVYELKPDYYPKYRTITTGKISASTAAQNKTQIDIGITLDLENELLSLNMKESAYGHNKMNIYGKCLYGADFYDYDRKLYKDPKYDPNKYDTKNAVKIAEYKRKEKERNEEREKDRIEHLKENLKEDYDLESYDEFKIVQDGRLYDKQELIINEKFKVKSLLKKVGPNYILDAGKIIGGQVEIKEDEMDRKQDVYMDYARSYRYDYTVEIPEGYTVEGVDKLAMNVDNETGAFISTARVEGNKLIVSAEKIYKTNFVKKEDWKKMVDFLDKAYDFTQVKVILKKS